MKMARVLGIAESFSLEPALSYLAGVVMKRDLTIDGVSVTNITVRGSDASSSIVNMYRKMKRNDISAIIVYGCILSMYNIVEGDAISAQTGLPVICMASKEGKNLEQTLMSHGNDHKVESYKSLGKQTSIKLKTGFTSWVRAFGLSIEEATNIINTYVMFGRVPEPVRVARLISTACLRNALKQIRI
ncbi:MAG: DUF99 family protein [Nitrososphaeria archaeon]